MQFISVEFESFVAEYYVNKAKSAAERQLPWKISLLSFRNMMRTTVCPYTGVLLTKPNLHAPKPTDITIDRIDNTKGYIPGNVMAISRQANNFKSIFENPKYPLDMGTAQVALGRMHKRVAKAKDDAAKKKGVGMTPAKL